MRGQRITAVPVRSAIAGQAGAGHPGDDVGGDVHLAHGAVHEFAEIHVAGRVDGYSPGYPDRGGCRRATVAGVADVIQATACEGGDHAAAEINLAHAVHAAVGDIEDIVRRAERDGLYSSELRGGRLAPVTAVAVRAVSGDGADDPARADAAYAEIIGVRDIHGTVGGDGHIAGGVERCRSGGAAITRESGKAVPGDGRHISRERRRDAVDHRRTEQSEKQEHGDNRGTQSSSYTCPHPLPLVSKDTARLLVGRHSVNCRQRLGR